MNEVGHPPWATKARTWIAVRYLLLFAVTWWGWKKLDATFKERADELKGKTNAPVTVTPRTEISNGVWQIDWRYPYERGIRRTDPIHIVEWRMLRKEVHIYNSDNPSHRIGELKCIGGDHPSYVWKSFSPTNKGIWYIDSRKHSSNELEVEIRGRLLEDHGRDLGTGFRIFYGEL